MKVKVKMNENRTDMDDDDLWRHVFRISHDTPDTAHRSFAG